MVNGVAVGVADRVPMCVREDGHEPWLTAVSVQAFTERDDRVVRQVEERRAHFGLYIEEVAADRVESDERAQFDGRRRVHAAIFQGVTCSVQVCTLELPGAVARSAAPNSRSTRLSRACWVTASAGASIAVVVAALRASWASESGYVAVGVVLSGRVDAERQMERLRTAPSLLPALRLAEYANASRYPSRRRSQRVRRGGRRGSPLRRRREAPAGRPACALFTAPGFSATRSGRGLSGG